MKPRHYAALIGACLTVPAFGQWAVFDVANLTQNVTNYAAMVQQLAKQAEQISHQIQQIQHMEDQLKRMGKMSEFTDLVGFPELKLNLALPTKIKTWSESLLAVDGYGLFGDTRAGIFAAVSSSFLDFDGTVVPRDPERYKAAHEVTTKVDNFKEVQADVYVRREDLKAAVAKTSEALQAATTDAEERKLEAVLNAQYSQLAVLDSEVALSAAEIQVKTAESQAMEQAQTKASAEARVNLSQQEARKISTAFKPLYGSILLYVKEEPYVP